MTNNQKLSQSLRTQPAGVRRYLSQTFTTAVDPVGSEVAEALLDAHDDLRRTTSGAFDQHVQDQLELRSRYQEATLIQPGAKPSRGTGLAKGQPDSESEYDEASVPSPLFHGHGRRSVTSSLLPRVDTCSLAPSDTRAPGPRDTHTFDPSDALNLDPSETRSLRGSVELARPLSSNLDACSPVTVSTAFTSVDSSPISQKDSWDEGGDLPGLSNQVRLSKSTVELRTFPQRRSSLMAKVHMRSGPPPATPARNPTRTTHLFDTPISQHTTSPSALPADQATPKSDSASSPAAYTPSRGPRHHQSAIFFHDRNDNVRPRRVTPPVFIDTDITTFGRSSTLPLIVDPNGLLRDSNGSSTSPPTRGADPPSSAATSPSSSRAGSSGVTRRPSMPTKVWAPPKYDPDAPVRPLRTKTIKATDGDAPNFSYPRGSPTKLRNLADKTSPEGKTDSKPPVLMREYPSDNSRSEPRPQTALSCNKFDGNKPKHDFDAPTDVPDARPSTSLGFAEPPPLSSTMDSLMSQIDSGINTIDYSDSEESGSTAPIPPPIGLSRRPSKVRRIASAAAGLHRHFSRHRPTEDGRPASLPHSDVSSWLTELTETEDEGESKPTTADASDLDHHHLSHTFHPAFPRAGSLSSRPSTSSTHSSRGKRLTGEIDSAITSNHTSRSGTVSGSEKSLPKTSSWAKAVDPRAQKKADARRKKILKVGEALSKAFNIG